MRGQNQKGTESSQKSQETRTRYCEKTTNVRANGLVRLIWMWDFFLSVHLASPPLTLLGAASCQGTSLKRLGNGCPFIYFSLSFLFPGPYPPFSGQVAAFSSCVFPSFCCCPHLLPFFTSLGSGHWFGYSVFPTDTFRFAALEIIIIALMTPNPKKC